MGGNPRNKHNRSEAQGKMGLMSPQISMAPGQLSTLKKDNRIAADHQLDSKSTINGQSGVKQHGDGIKSPKGQHGE